MELQIPDSMLPTFERTEHPFHMWDELLQTPQALAAVLTPTVTKAIEQIAVAIKDVQSIHLLGCGTSYFSAIAGTYLLQPVTGLPAQAHNAFEFSAYPPAGILNSAVIGISHTGGTAVVVDAIELAKKAGAVTIGLTDVDQSPLQRAAAYNLPGGYGREKPLPKTRSYPASLLKHYLLALAMGTQRGLDVSQMKAHLQASAQMAEDLLTAQLPLAKRIAAELQHASQIFMFGAGPNTASVFEGTLKLQETAQANVHGFELEEGMHGPWVTMEENDLVIVFAPKGPAFEKAKKLIEAIAAVRPKVWVLTDAPEEVSGATYFSQLPAVPEFISPLYAILPIYQFTYHLALARGKRPDVMRLTDERYLRARLQLPR